MDYESALISVNSMLFGITSMAENKDAAMIAIRRVFVQGHI
jgi:hypothetical protein